MTEHALIVSHDAELVAAAEDTLRRMGHGWTVAASLVEARQRMADTPCSYVLLGRALPKRDDEPARHDTAVEFLRAMPTEQGRAHPPVVVLCCEDREVTTKPERQAFLRQLATLARAGATDVADPDGAVSMAAQVTMAAVRNVERHAAGATAESPASGRQGP